MPSLGRGPLRFMLMNPCDVCTRKKMGCDRVIPCSTRHCEDCEPSDREWVTRAKRVFQEVRKGAYHHNDLSKYQIYLQSLVFDTKGVLTRQDVLDIFGRLNNQYQESIVAVAIDQKTMDDMPTMMKDLIEGAEVAKVEWFQAGRYKVSCSPGYETNFTSTKEILQMANQYRIPAKLVDTSGFNQFDTAYRVWSESLYLPGVVIAFTGPAYWKGDKDVFWTKTRVLSYVENHDTFMTVTVMRKERQSCFYRPFE